MAFCPVCNGGQPFSSHALDCRTTDGPEADDTSAPFNGADPAAFDHDGDSRPGGSKPRRYPLIDRATGVVVVVGAKARNKALAAGDARLATARDLRLAGRRDLIPLLTA